MCMCVRWAKVRLECTDTSSPSPHTGAAAACTLWESTPRLCGLSDVLCIRRQRNRLLAAEVQSRQATVCLSQTAERGGIREGEMRQGRGAIHLIGNLRPDDGYLRDREEEERRTLDIPRIKA